MDRIIYSDIAANEEKHWWFIGRRNVINRTLSCYHNGRDWHILEIGCGSGGNLKMLSEYGTVFGIEPDDEVRVIAQRRAIAPVKKGALPFNIPFGTPFDLICLFDVLEHLDDELVVLNALNHKLASKGKLLVTVPAYNFLWSAHDDLNEHKRRYVKKKIIELLQQSGFNILYATYFNSLISPVIVAARFLNKIFGQAEMRDIKIPPDIINKFLTRLFSLERVFIPKIALPFGVSILVLAEKSS